MTKEEAEVEMERYLAAQREPPGVGRWARSGWSRSSGSASCSRGRGSWGW